jgi:hypothetical protein
LDILLDIVVVDFRKAEVDIDNSPDMEREHEQKGQSAAGWHQCVKII